MMIVECALPGSGSANSLQLGLIVLAIGGPLVALGLRHTFSGAVQQRASRGPVSVEPSGGTSAIVPLIETASLEMPSLETAAGEERAERDERELVGVR
jgi:hypothetical protein